MASDNTDISSQQGNSGPTRQESFEEVLDKIGPKIGPKIGKVREIHFVGPIGHGKTALLGRVYEMSGMQSYY